MTSISNTVFVDARSASRVAVSERGHAPTYISHVVARTRHGSCDGIHSPVARANARSAPTIKRARMRIRLIVGARRIVPCASSKIRPLLPMSMRLLGMLVYIYTLVYLCQVRGVMSALTWSRAVRGTGRAVRRVPHASQRMLVSYLRYTRV